jgi:beta-galactosidase GanA
MDMRRLAASVLLAAHALACAQGTPALERRGQATQLVVDGRPFLVLGGELHNSSSSTLAHLAPLWVPLKAQHLNTALVAVSWELVEPSEGWFDFSLVDGIVAQAREHDMKVALLWFGSWKNGLSHYAPEWVKRDTGRFPRVQLADGRHIETITPVSREAQQADARAFGALMRHLKDIDSTRHTVVMVQVENEVGVIGAARDHSKAADAAFAGPVPAALAKLGTARRSSGTWSEVFGAGPAADEAFMAWHYARYVDAVAAAGKKEYALPMWVNAWIVQPEDQTPGDYPSGGPQSHVHDIWRAGAPSIDILAPDVYLPDMNTIAGMYRHSWNPLFVPESFAGEQGAANAFLVIGRFNAIGYSPFGIDTRAAGDTAIEKAYGVLAKLAPEILAAQSSGGIAGFSIEKPDGSRTAELNGYRIRVTVRRDWKGAPQAQRGYGLVMQNGPDSFTVAGKDIDVTFEPATPGPRTAGIAQMLEQDLVGGAWTTLRVLNGDDIMMSYKLADEAAANRSGTGVRLKAELGVVRVKLYRYD